MMLPYQIGITNDLIMSRRARKDFETEHINDAYVTVADSLPYRFMDSPFPSMGLIRICDPEKMLIDGLVWCSVAF